jgi:hypothetical protein
MEPNVSQALHFINAEDFNKKISEKGGVIDRLLGAGMGDRAIIDELYLACFSREASKVESANNLGIIRAALASAQTEIDRNEARRGVFVDLLWALLSSPEFQFNH